MKKKSLLLSSLALLVVAMIAFTGATYAWFVAGAAPKVDNMQVKVADVGVIKIGTKEAGWSAWSDTVGGNYRTNFSTTVTETQIKASEGVVNPNWATPARSLNPTSAIKNTTPGDTDILAPGSVDFDGTFKFINMAKAADTQNYIKYDLFFTNEGTTPFIVSLDTSVLTKFWVQAMADYAGIGATTEANPGQEQIATSLRAAFVSDQIKATVNNSAKVVYNAGSTVGAIIYEPDKATLDTTSDATFWAANDRTQGGTITPATYPTFSVSDGAVIDLFKIESIMTAGAVDLATKSGNIVQLSVYLWIEGNDLDCLSGVAGYFFTSLIQFAVRAA